MPGVADIGTVKFSVKSPSEAAPLAGMTQICGRSRKHARGADAHTMLVTAAIERTKFGYMRMVLARGDQLQS